MTTFLLTFLVWLFIGLISAVIFGTIIQALALRQAKKNHPSRYYERD